MNLPHKISPVILSGFVIVLLLLLWVLFRFLYAETGIFHGNILLVEHISASTNSPAETFTLYADGSATDTGTYIGAATQIPIPHSVGSGTLNLTKVEADLATLGGVQMLGSPGCIKSVSFGTTTTITYQGLTSGDISCDQKASQLSQDLQDLQNIVLTGKSS